MKIKWTNKWSGDTGYVKSINSKKKEFENTFNESEAKVFSKNVITYLQTYIKSDILYGIEIANTYGADVIKLLLEY